MSIIVLNLPPERLSDRKAFLHIFEASFGIGVLSMPIAFSRAGLLGGVLGIIVTGIICTHCASILVTCARILHQRTGQTAMTYPQIAKYACEAGPVWSRPFGNAFKYTLMHFLFFSYFGASAAYTVVVAKSVQQLVNHHWGIAVDLRLYLVALVVPFVLISWIPKLKWMTKVTFLTNLCMLIGLIILVNFLVTDMSPVSERPLFGHMSTLPSFFAIVIFAFEAIGVIMPLENHEQIVESEEYTSRFGVMAQGLTMILVVYIVIGFLGYVKYGEGARGSITLNLPDDYIPTQVVKILITLSVYGTFGLQFSICLDIAWRMLQLWTTWHSKMASYCLRSLLVTVTVLLGIALPKTPPFIGLLGGLCFSLLGILAPVCIETITYWDDGFGRYHWRAIKNIFIGIFGMVAVIFGTMYAVDEIVALYK